MSKKLLKERFRKNLIESGQPIYSSPPYGYRFDFSSETFCQIENEVEVVKTVYDLALKGLRVSQIVALLNQKEIKPRKGGEWERHMISRILTNPFYVGVQRLSYLDVNNVRIYTAIKNPSIVPIVSEQEFDSVQEIYKSSYRETKKADTVLNNLLFCDCGNKIISKSISRPTKQESERHYNIYHCTNTPKCFSVKKDYLEEPIINCIIMQDIRSLLIPAEQEAESVVTKAQIQLNTVKNEIDEIKQDTDKLFSKMVETKSLIEAGSLMLEIDAVKKQIKNKEKEYKVAESALETAQDELACINNLRNIKGVDQFFASASSKEKKKLLHCIIARITYTNATSTGEIEFRNGIKHNFKTI